jgi:hypothetical protein
VSSIQAHGEVYSIYTKLCDKVVNFSLTEGHFFLINGYIKPVYTCGRLHGTENKNLYSEIQD